MDTGELVGILIVVVVLLIGTLIISVRCCRSACTLLRESSAQDSKFSSAVREGLRRSIRRISFRRRGNSFRQKKQEPVAKVATIEELHRERSELHPKYQAKLIQREEGDGAVDTDARATANVPDCTVHFMQQNDVEITQQTKTATCSEKMTMLNEVKLQVVQERLVRSDPLPSIDVSNESSTDTTPMTTRNHGNSGTPVSSHMVELNLLETGDGFSNPGYESGSMLDLVPHDDEDGGFENPGYLVIGTPEPPRSRQPTNPDPRDSNQTRGPEHSQVDSRHSKSLAEDFKDIQLQSKCLIDLQGETDVDGFGDGEIHANKSGSEVKLSPSGIILGISKPFTRGGVNRASIGALKSRPGKLTEENIKRITVDGNAESPDISAADRYYQEPVKNPMYPERTQIEEEPEQAPTYVHACYELTGTGVIFSDEDTNALTSDSFI